ncbi:hypothetical protein AMECASPLE_033558, partial [Ameca splendens]
SIHPSVHVSIVYTSFIPVLVAWRLLPFSSRRWVRPVNPVYRSIAHTHLGHTAW